MASIWIDTQEWIYGATYERPATPYIVGSGNNS